MAIKKRVKHKESEATHDVGSTTSVNCMLAGVHFINFLADEMGYSEKWRKEKVFEAERGWLNVNKIAEYVMASLNKELKLIQKTGMDHLDGSDTKLVTVSQNDGRGVIKNIFRKTGTIRAIFIDARTKKYEDAIHCFAIPFKVYGPYCKTKSSGFGIQFDRSTYGKPRYFQKDGISKRCWEKYHVASLRELANS